MPKIDRKSFAEFTVWKSGTHEVDTNGVWFSLLERVDGDSWRVQELRGDSDEFMARVKYYLSPLELAGLTVTLTNLGHLK